MPQSVTITSVTANTPVEIYYCDSFSASCVYVSTVSVFPYTFDVPSPYDETNIVIKIEDVNGCVDGDIIYITPTPTSSVTPTTTQTPTNTPTQTATPTVTPTPMPTAMEGDVDGDLQPDLVFLGGDRRADVILNIPSGVVALRAASSLFAVGIGIAPGDQGPSVITVRKEASSYIWGSLDILRGSEKSFATIPSKGQPVLGCYFFPVLSVQHVFRSCF
jgi:hypothetical protein